MATLAAPPAAGEHRPVIRAEIVLAVPNEREPAMRRTCFPASAAAAMGLALSLLPGAALAAGNTQRGKIIAETNCAGCHAIGPTGESPNPKSPPFRTLSKKFKLDNLEEALAEGITVGHQGMEMPEFQFDPPQIEDFIAYLKSVNAP
jgi:cytochrome c